MDTDPLITDDVPAPERLPLLTLDEAQQAVDLLRHFEDDTEQGRAAGQLAADLARRIPSLCWGL